MTKEQLLELQANMQAQYDHQLEQVHMTSGAIQVIAHMLDELNKKEAANGD